MATRRCKEKSSASPSLSQELSRWLSPLPTLNEAQARLYMGQKALELGRGGISRIASITGMSRLTISKGIKELRAGIDPQQATRIRKKGGGRTKVGQERMGSEPD